MRFYTREKGMSMTRIHCSECGLAQIYCLCGKETVSISKTLAETLYFCLFYKNREDADAGLKQTMQCPDCKAELRNAIRGRRAGRAAPFAAIAPMSLSAMSADLKKTPEEMTNEWLLGIDEEL